jgi:prepilin-type N-terminal cleavage/methylation domain-containing protein
MLNRTKKAFTLLELIVVLLILGILAAIAVPTFNTVKTNAAERTFQATADAVARNASAIAVSAGAGSVSQLDLTTAASEAGFGTGDITLLEDEGTFVGINIQGAVGSYDCNSNIVFNGLTATAGEASCS